MIVNKDEDKAFVGAFAELIKSGIRGFDMR
jgi:hypothetical protein